jgi:hypothetical protein
LDEDLKGTKGGYDTWTSSPGNNELKPIVCANWYEAYAFCIWDGGFLPQVVLEYVPAAVLVRQSTGCLLCARENPGYPDS